MVNPAFAQSPHPQLHVLLVEDNPSDAYLISSLLSTPNGKQCELHHADMQTSALAALADQAFDVCLLDLTLPDAVGFSALIDIQEKAPDMPVLILTGTRDAALAKRAVGRGAQDYLLKDELELARLSRSMDYAIERKQIEKELQQRANYDALTGLANRSLLENRLKMALVRAERTASEVAVLFIDLDGFKQINDIHGHEAGDEALRSVAGRLKSVLRGYDTAARLGGDEFVILLEDINSPHLAALIAQKILWALSPPIRYRDKQLTLGGSVGIALSGESMTAERLLQQADAAMYRAKSEGGNAYRFYVPDTNREMGVRLKMEQELRHAISTEQLRLYYQPYVNPEGGTVLGVEALLRWAHPDQGLLQPGEFLPVAEESRLMLSLAEWMFSALENDVALWRRQALPPLQIAVNISLSQLDAPGFIPQIARLAKPDVLGEHRLAVEMEGELLTCLTETRFLTLAKLREMGVLLHLDHFGKGAMSLQSLHTFPFSLLKLDLSLIQAMKPEEGNSIIHTAILLAHQLGMKAGAVGIEAPWQVQALRAQHCDAVQGFYLSPPMMAEQFARWMQSHPGKAEV